MTTWPSVETLYSWYTSYSYRDAYCEWLYALFLTLTWDVTYW